MSYSHGEHVPSEIRPSEAKRFAALRRYRRKRGQELTVEEFANRRKWGIHSEKTQRRINAPQTAEGVLSILRAKGLAP